MKKITGKTIGNSTLVKLSTDVRQGNKQTMCENLKKHLLHCDNIWFTNYALTLQMTDLAHINWYRHFIGAYGTDETES